MSRAGSASYVFIRNGRNSVAVQDESGQQVAVAGFRWTGLQFSVRHVNGTVFKGSSKWWSLPTRLTVYDAGGNASMWVRKNLLNAGGLVRMANGDEYTVDVNERKPSFRLLAADGTVAAQVAYATSSSRLAENVRLTVADGDLLTMDSFCMVLAWVALNASPSFKDRGYGASNSASYM